MRSFRFGLIGALAAVSLGMFGAGIRMVEPPAPPRLAVPVRRHKGRSPPNPTGKSGQHLDTDRLIHDRASSVKKLMRWARAGSAIPREPSEQEFNRHRERRRDRQREQNLRRMMS